MSKRKLTKRIVESIESGGKDIIVWDSEVKGFGFKVTPRGQRSFFFYYRTAEGQQRRPKVGDFGELTVEQARQMAQVWAAAVRRGEDPGMARRNARQAPTVSELCDQYLTEYAEREKRPRSVRDDRRLIENEIRPTIGSRKVAAVTREDVELLHRRVSNRAPIRANRLVALISKMFSLSIQWGLRPDNPAKGIRKNPEVCDLLYAKTGFSFGWHWP